MATSDALYSALKTEIDKEAAAANSIAQEVRAAKAGNPDKVAAKYVSKTPVEEVPDNVREIVEKFREGEKKILATLDAQRTKAEKAVKDSLPQAMSPEDLTAKTAAHKGHADKFKGFRKSLVDLDASEEQLAALPKLLTLGGGTSNGSTGTGRPKPRFAEITLDGHSVAKTVDGKRVCTPTVLAEKINSQHSNDENWQKVNSAEIVDLVLAQDAEVSSQVTLTSFRGQHNIVLTPKDKNA